MNSDFYFLLGISQRLVTLGKYYIQDKYAAIASLSVWGFAVD